MTPVADADDDAVTPVRQLMHGPFGWFFLGRTIDLFGSSMTTVALALAVLQASGRPSDLGIVLAANMVPNLALLLIGGTIADRVSRRVVLLVGNGLNAAVMGALAVVLIAHAYSLGLVAGLSVADGALSAFTTPALRGLVPQLVHRRDLQRANALLASTRNAVRIVAPTVAGLIVATAGGGCAIAVDAASFLLSALVLARLPLTQPAVGTSGVWRDLREGWRTYTSLPWVVVMTVAFAVINAVNVGPWNVLGPLRVSHASGDAAWGGVLSVRAVGLLLMSVVAVRITLRHPLRTGRVLGVLGALPLLALGLAPSGWVVAGAALLGGVGFTLSGITWETALGRHVPSHLLSRVAAYDDLLSYIAIPASQVATPFLAERFGGGRVVLLAGIVYAVASLAPLLHPAVRNAD